MEDFDFLEKDLKELNQSFKNIKEEDIDKMIVSEAVTELARIERNSRLVVFDTKNSSSLLDEDNKILANILNNSKIKYLKIEQDNDFFIVNI